VVQHAADGARGRRAGGVADVARERRARVLVLTEAVGRARGSGVPIRQPAAHVLSDFRNGVIGKDRTFLSWDAARKTVGLAEPIGGASAADRTTDV
jgi:hypothetical protein